MAGRVALAVGNSAYAAGLANPSRDASAIADILRDLDFTVAVSTDLTCDAMEDALLRFEQAIQGSDVALFYFAGHGIQVKGENYLIPVDTTLTSELHLRRRAFSLTEILSSMEFRARHSLLFIDACRDNPYANSLIEDKERVRDVAPAGLAELRPHLKKSSFIAFATAPNTVAFDGDGDHSPFAQALLDNIARPNLSIADMMIEVRQSVRKATKDRQIPWDQSSLGERFCFKVTADGSDPARSATHPQKSKPTGEQLFNQRPHDLFLSYVRADSAHAEPLLYWLRNVAGLAAAGGTDALPKRDRVAGFANARIGLLGLSRQSIASTATQDAIASALLQSDADRRFRTVVLLFDDCEVPAAAADATVLDMQTLNAQSGSILLEALVPEPALWSHGDRDVYFSRSWRPADFEQADVITAAMVRGYGFRLIGDSPDYRLFDEETRLRRMIDSCGALLALFPFRHDEAAHGFTSKFMIKEAEIALELGRPCLLFADRRVKLPAALTEAGIKGKVFAVPDSADDPVLLEILDDFNELYQKSPNPTYSFFATSLLRDGEENERAVSILERVTAMNCFIGQGLDGHAQMEIIERIRKAQFVVADVTDNDHNSLIEAGIARGAGIKLELVSRRPADGKLGTRFMLRDLEVSWYADPLERIGQIHRIARKYRRRVIHPRND